MSNLSKSLNRVLSKQLKLRPEILLCPNVPRPLHGVAPRVVLGSKWWNVTRQKAYKSTLFCCLACGVHKSRAKHRKWMEGHELYKVDYNKGRMLYLEAVPLCHFCHNYIHDGRMQAMVEQGKMSHQKFAAILQHGDEILQAAGLKRLTHLQREEQWTEMILNGTMAAWKDWRLQIGRKLYEPKFKTEVHWRKAMKK